MAKFDYKRTIKEFNLQEEWCTDKRTSLNTTVLKLKVGIFFLFELECQDSSSFHQLYYNHNFYNMKKFEYLIKTHWNSEKETF